ncbi:hypothetical protein CCACVL1_17843, partial [Corchorus capsularis]
AKSTCDSSRRHYLPLPKKNSRLWSSKSWISQVSTFTQLGILKKHSKVLCISAGTGHEVMALSKMGMDDVTDFVSIRKTDGSRVSLKSFNVVKAACEEGSIGGISKVKV